MLSSGFELDLDAATAEMVMATSYHNKCNFLLHKEHMHHQKFRIYLQAVPATEFQLNQPRTQTSLRKRCILMTEDMKWKIII